MHTEKQMRAAALRHRIFFLALVLMTTDTFSHDGKIKG